MEKDHIKEILANTLLYHCLSKKGQGKLIEEGKEQHYALGDEIIGEKTSSEKIALVCSGKARVIRKLKNGQEESVKILEPGDLYGEHALLLEESYNETLRAASEVTTIEFSYPSLRAILDEDPQAKKLLSAIVQSSGFHAFLEEFRTYFSESSKKSLSAWLRSLDIKDAYPEGEAVYEADSKPDDFYIVISGELEGLHKDGRHSRNYHEGEVFGDTDFWREEPRKETIKAKKPSVVAALSIKDFNKAVREYPQLQEQMECTLLLHRNYESPQEKKDTEKKWQKRKSKNIPEPSEEPKKTYKPRVKKVFPFIKQYEEMDCGAACLAMITSYYGKRISMGRMRDLVNVRREGESLFDIALGAERLGYKARAIKATYDALLEIKLPMILHWKGYHFVVLYKANEKTVKIADPAKGKFTLSREEFEKSWTGYGLLVEPTEDFESVEEDKPTFRRFTREVFRYKGMLSQVLLAAFLISLFGLATPFFTQTIIDNVIVNRDLDLLNILLVGMLAITLFSGITSLLRAYLITHVGNKIEIRLLGQFLGHVLSVPMDFFNVRKVGDVLARFAESTKIQNLLTGRLIEIIMDLLMAVIYLAIMFAYSLPLTLIVLGFIPILIIISAIIASIFKKLSRLVFDRGAATKGYLIESVNGISSIKSATAELATRWAWETLFLRELEMRLKVVVTGSVARVISNVVNTLLVIMVLWYGARQVIGGDISLGQLIAFQTLSRSFLTPLLNLVNQWTTLQEAVVSLEKLNDIYDVKPEEPTSLNLISLPDIKGKVAFRDVSFAYNKNDKWVLKNIDFEAEPGQVTAIVGRSGSGKTTMANLIMRFYNPAEGHVVVDDHDLKNLCIGTYRRQLGAVVQDSFLFSGTIRDNIALGAPDAPMDKVVEAAKMSAAHEFISKLPMGYETKIGERGMNLSGGERQRLCIARALLRDPRILIFDEATSFLDAESEKRILQNLGKIIANRTTFIIAHRLSTIRNADQILVVDDGCIVERGKHKELMEKQGLYYYLNKESLDMQGAT